MTQRVRVDMLGASFHVQAGEGDQYLDDVVAYLRQQVDNVRRETPVADPLKIALLAALNVTDELLRERRLGAGDGKPELDQIGQITSHLIDRIDESLVD
jgi:cell division protein ZapA (FtsZ GTPase activity inhibitor)